MSKIILTYVGEDSWNRPTFKVNDTDCYVKDVNLADNKGNLYLHWSSPKNDIDGEPDYPFRPKEGVEVEIVGFNPISKKDRFNYQMLGRLEADCKYYLGNGNRCINRLYYLDIKEHIQAMRDLYNSFSDDKKPEWLTMEQIEDYEKRMLGE